MRDRTPEPRDHARWPSHDLVAAVADPTRKRPRSVDAFENQGLLPAQRGQVARGPAAAGQLARGGGRRPRGVHAVAQAAKGARYPWGRSLSPEVSNPLGTPPPSAAPLDPPRWAGLGLGGGGNPSPAPSGSRRGGYRPVGPGVPLADGLNTRIHTVSISINRVIIPYLYLSNISKRYMNHRLRHGEPLAPFRRNEVCCGRDRAPVGHREGPRALGVLMPARGGGSLFCTY